MGTSVRALVTAPAWMGEAKCAVCQAIRSAVGLASTSVKPHWRHPRKSDCPLVLWERRGAHEFEADSDVSTRLRREACGPGNLGRAYIFALHLFGTGNLPVAGFAELMKAADARHLWRLKGVAPWNLPYRLAAMSDQTKDSRGGAAFEFRFKSDLVQEKRMDFLEKISAVDGTRITRFPFAFWKFNEIAFDVENAAWYAGSRAEKVIQELSTQLLAEDAT